MKILRKEDRFAVRESYENERRRRLKPWERALYSGHSNDFGKVPIEIIEDEQPLENLRRTVLFVYTEEHLKEKGLQEAKRFEVVALERDNNVGFCQVEDRKPLKNILSRLDIFSPQFTMDQQEANPCLLTLKDAHARFTYGGRNYWAYKGEVFSTQEDLTPEVVKALILDLQERHRAKVASALARVNREEDGAEEWAGRLRISDEVKMFVWRRDEGKCVRCGSNVNLEFDHIIPVAMGGATTARNLQLLCEPCNRGKGASLV